MTPPDYFLNKINGIEFAKQRSLVNDLLYSDRLTAKEKDKLEGLINLLDTLADYLTDNLKIDSTIKEDTDIVVSKEEVISIVCLISESNTVEITKVINAMNDQELDYCYQWAVNEFYYANDNQIDRLSKPVKLIGLE
jgi:hypothetical protein